MVSLTVGGMLEGGKVSPGKRKVKDLGSGVEIF